MHRALVLVALAVVTGSGCYTVNADLPGTLRGDVAPQETERVGTMTIEKSHWFYLLGLIGEAPPNLFADDIKKSVQQKGADGVTNLVYESKIGCLDLVITGCSAGCVAPRTYKVTGDLVRIKKPPPPGKPAKVADVDVPAWMKPASKVARVSDVQRF